MHLLPSLKSTIGSAHFVRF